MKMKVLFLISAFLLDQGVSDAGSDGVKMLVKKADSVTLPTDFKINHQDRMTWYFNGIRIAHINGVQKICTDVQCKERFRDRLKLDHQSGSLTITDTRTTDSGEYKLLIGGSRSAKIFGVIVTEVKSVMEGEHVTLNTSVTEHEMVRWYFNDTLIALIDGSPNTSCLYDGEGGRFRDRLEAHYKTGSLIITNIRSEHAGRYEAEIIRSESLGQRQSLNRTSKCDSTKITTKSSNLGEIIQSFSLTVSASKADKNEEPQKAPQNQNIDASSGLSSAAVAGIVVGGVVVVVLLVAAAIVVGRRKIDRCIFRNDIKKNKQLKEQVSNDEIQNERSLMI